MSTVEVIRTEITPEQRKDIISALNSAGFNVGRQGHIRVTKSLQGYHKYARVHLPVGYLGPDLAMLVNLDTIFPQDYHADLRKILVAAP